MKHVILIGDSIRMNYQAVVHRQLEELAHVWAPEDNGGNSQNVLAHLDTWVLSRQPDIVHINCGLHDIKRPYGSDVHAISLNDYAVYVRQILTQIQQQTRAILIWATTTPVNQAWHHERKGFDRFEADVDAYNAVALGIAEELGIPINDLFKVVTDAGRDDYLLPDGVHFTEAGSALLGKVVANFIKQYV
jgi:lysophospholipase L1-like esterase